MSTIKNQTTAEQGDLAEAEPAQNLTLSHRWVEPHSGGGRSRRRTAKAISTVEGMLTRQRKSTLTTTCFVFIARATPLALPFLLRETMRPILDHEPFEMLGRVWTPEGLLLFVLCASGCIAAIRALANYGYIANSGRSGHMFVSDLRTEMYNHILRLPLSYSERRDTGKIMLRFIGDSDALRIWISRTQPTVYVDLAMLALTSAAMFWIDRSLALVAFAVLPVLGLGVLYYTPKLRALTRTSRSMQAGFTGHVQSRIDAIKESKWLDAMPGFRERTRRRARSIARQNARRERIAAAIDSLGEASMVVLVPPLIWFGAHRVWAGTLTSGDLVALVWLALHLSSSIHRLSSAVAIHQKAQISLQRVVRLLGRPSERSRGSSLAKFSPEGTSIEFKGVVAGNEGSPTISVALAGPGVCVLDEDIPMADVLEPLLGFKRIRQGTVSLDGTALEDLNVVSVRAALGWVPLEPVIFDATIKENILMGKPKAKAREITRAMSSLGIEKKDVDAWLERQAGPNGRNLSDVEQYEIGLLRVALRASRFVFVEPVCGTELSEPMRKAVRFWQQDTLIVMEHDDAALLD